MSRARSSARVGSDLAVVSERGHALVLGLMAPSSAPGLLKSTKVNERLLPGVATRLHAAEFTARTVALGAFRSHRK